MNNLLMREEVWTPFNPKDFNLYGVHCKGSSTKTVQSRTIPGQTATEANLESGLANYANTGINNSSGLLSKANSAIGSTVNPNWSTLANNYNNTMSDVSGGYQSLANGELPSSYTDNIMSGLNSLVSSSMGNAINNANSRGILNSSVTNAALNDVSSNVANTAANKYLDAMNNYSGILGNQASNASNILSNNSSAQQASYYQPSQLLTYANSEYSPASNLYNTMYSGRMGTGSTSTTSNDGGASTWEAVGSLGSAAILACFAAGTMISTPYGDKPIERIKVGDKVIDVNGNEETVTYTNPATMCSIVELTTDIGIVKTTDTQRFYTIAREEPEYVMDIKSDILTKNGTVKVLKRRTLPPKLVYDFSVTGTNSFFANGLASEGWD